MDKNNKIVLASGNNGKLRELRDLLIDFDYELFTQSELGVESVAETGLTFVENALIKARHACQVTGLPAISDDSGLVVAALNGEPGVRSARFAGDDANDEKNIARLLLQLEATPHEARAAYFVSICVFMRAANDPSPIIGQGYWHGSILSAPVGEAGFGYDPVFYVPSHHCSAGQLDKDVKNQISHRGQAMQQLRQGLLHHA